MIQGKNGPKLFVVTKWLLPGPERACKLAPPDGGYNSYVLNKRTSTATDRTQSCDRNCDKKLSYSTPIKVRNGTKAAKVLGDEVIDKKCAEFEQPRTFPVKTSEGFKIPEPLSTPKHNGLSKNNKNAMFSTPTFNGKCKNSEIRTPDSNKKISKSKDADEPKESFLRTLKRRSLRVTRSRSWVSTEKRKSGEWLFFLSCLMGKIGLGLYYI